MMDSPVGEIMLLHRTGIVEDYTNNFLALACHNADLTEVQLVQMYMAGLVNSLKTDIALCRRATLNEAIMLARAYEQCMQLSSTDPGHTLGGRMRDRADMTVSSAAPGNIIDAPTKI
jgi:hypothetical protein